MEISFENLPQAVHKLNEKLSSIEKLLLENRIGKNSDEDQLLTIQQAAEVLSLSVPTIYGYVHASEIPYSKVKKRLYFSKKELTEWVRTGRKKTLSEIEASAHTHLKKKA
ncbi:MAG: helix-turn-helix domain-containing protein [Bacteroidetes bacterium]|nr:helix-turn-helix domain-containing protein [Bacteroidota bacterium]